MPATTTNPTTTFLDVCPLEELPVGLGREFRIGSQDVAIFRSREGAVFACEARCPHKGAPLADGMLAGDQVVCPFHAYRYDSQTGTCDQSGAESVQMYPIEVVGQMVRIQLPSLR